VNRDAGDDPPSGTAGDAGGGSPARRRVRVTVGGRVQGVWFRASTQQEALTRGVDGWVRNRADGQVEAVFEGPPAAVAALVAWVHQGPEGASVTDVQVIEEPDRGERGFSVR
jgi:acylphosphatase